MSLPKPVPAVHLHLLDLVFEFWCLSGNSFREDQRHTSPHSVRLHPLKITVPGDLLLFGRFPVNTDRAVLDDEPDFLLAGQILKVHNGVVLPYLLDIPLDLLLSGDVAVDAELAADIIAYQD